MAWTIVVSFNRSGIRSAPITQGCVWQPSWTSMIP